MDLYLPAKAEVPPPMVVFFSGGGWRSGDRATYRFVGRSLAACGAMVFIPDYRVWPDAGFPGFLHDAAAAVAVARTEGERRGGDVSRVFLMGHSAGAYIAAMLALDPSYLSASGLNSRTASGRFRGPLRAIRFPAAARPGAGGDFRAGWASHAADHVRGQRQRAVAAADRGG